MPILTGDIKLVASQVMDDVPEGGGPPTSHVILDGVSNGIFPDISEVARAGGRVNMRKLHVSVQTEDTDTYLDCNVIVAAPPTDPNVSVTLFSTNQVFDRRTEAQSRVENYMTDGPVWNGFLFENHVRGQSKIQLFQMIGAEVPPVGRTLRIVQNEGLATEISQPVRVTRVTTSVRSFARDNGQIYQAAVVALELSDKLRYDFLGSPPSELFRRIASAAVVRDTVVANAAEYFGVSPLVQPVALGAISAKVKSIFTQLVPSAQTEIPVVNASAAGEYDTLVDASSGNVTIQTAMAFSPNVGLYFGNPVYPGTLKINYAGGVLTDAGGELLQGTTAIGTVDYARGTAVLSSSAPNIPGAKTITFRAAGAPLRLADSAGIYVSAESRAYSYLTTIDPPPAPGTVVVSYRSNGQWYDLRDRGDGVLRGQDVEFGSGTVSPSTGTVSVTLGALPDVDSTIILGWGATVSYFNRAAVPVPALEVPIQLGQVGITPGSLVVKWNDGTARTVNDDGKGNLTGAATGTIRYQTGEVKLRPAALPAGGQTYSVEYSHGAPSAKGFPAPLRDLEGTVTLNLATVGLQPGTVELTWNLLVENYDTISTTPAEMQLLPRRDPYKTIRDDGLGHLNDDSGNTLGTVNYGTGKLTFNPDVTISIPVPRYLVTQIGLTSPAPGAPVYRNLFSHFEYIPAAAIFPHDETGRVDVTYRDSAASSAVAESFTPGALRFDITHQYSEDIVPGSVNFALGDRAYFDRAGRLYYNVDAATGSGTLAGTINYQSGELVVNAWAPGASPAVALRSLLTTMDGQPVDEVTFRSPISPLRPGSVQLLATRLTGGLVNSTADTNGVIAGANVSGTVDYETGVIRARFGSWVVAAGNEAAIWYSPDAVRADGKIFKPSPVFANTIRFNGVGYSYLPLNADVLGLDPVRLPQDGRVVVYRPGNFVVLGHTASVEAAVSNSQVINAGRVRLSRVRVVGHDGLVINTGYTADLEAGTVTFTDVSGYSQPVKVENRIEDMVMLSDVGINGELSFTKRVSHDYPVEGSYVSSAMMALDLKARVSTLFDQAAWNGVSWADAVSGSVAAGTYNDVLAPIRVTNRGAITERWALRFTTNAAFEVIGEHVGVIGKGTIDENCAPLNPATGSPYWTMAALGFGGGWVPGNIIRHNTVGAMASLWLVRTIQPGDESVLDDEFTLLVRGGVDRP